MKKAIVLRVLSIVFVALFVSMPVFAQVGIGIATANNNNLNLNDNQNFNDNLNLNSNLNLNLNNNTNTLSNQQSQNQSQSQSQNQGQSQSARSLAVSSSGGNQLTTGSQSVEVKTEVRPAASAPTNVLTSVGTDNCLGSVSGSFGNGFISLGGGSTKESVECNRRANSRRLEDLGFRRAAIALQCMNEEVREAMRIAGTNCP